MEKCCLFVNGEKRYLAPEEAKISSFDSAHQFGYAVYEVIAVANGRLFDVKLHLERLEKSLKAVNLPEPFSMAEVEATLKELLEQNKVGTGDGYVYLQVTRGSAGLKRDFLSSDAPSNFFAYYTRQVNLMKSKQQAGETVLALPECRWAFRDVKTTQLMYSCMAKDKATATGHDDAVYIDSRNNITEGASTNTFVVKNGQIITHPANSKILHGITRQRVIELARKSGMRIEERPFSLDEMLNADEVFRTSTTIGVRGITQVEIAESIFTKVEDIWQPKASQIGDHTIGKGIVGKITIDLAAKYYGLVHAETVGYANRMKLEIKLPKPKAIVFDWDNTLVDSWPIIHNAMVETFKHMGATPWSLEETKEKVGKSLRDHFPSLFGERWKEAGDLYSKTYREKHLTLQALPLAKELLEFLQSKNLYLAVVSNKQGPILRLEADYMGLTDYFDKLVGATDAVRDKPFPDPVILAMEGSGITLNENVWFVGDSITDVETAINTGCTPIFYGDAKLPDNVKDKVFYLDDHGHFRKIIDGHC